MPSWLTRTVAIVIMVAVVTAVLFGVMTLRSCQSVTVAKTEARMANAHTDAVVEDAKDAGNTAANVARAEGNNTQIVEDSQHDIRNASDAAGITSAGVNGLRRLGNASR